MTLLSTTNGQIWKPGFGVSPGTSADTTLMFSMVFMFTGCNILTVFKILIKVSERNMYPFLQKTYTHTHTDRQSNPGRKQKQKWNYISNKLYTKTLETVLFRTWLLFISALVLTYQSTAVVYLGTSFQKAIAKGRSLVSHLFTGTIPWVHTFKEVRWETDPITCHPYSCRVGTKLNRNVAFSEGECSI